MSLKLKSVIFSQMVIKSTAAKSFGDVVSEEEIVSVEPIQKCSSFHVGQFIIKFGNL